MISVTMHSIYIPLQSKCKVIHLLPIFRTFQSFSYLLQVKNHHKFTAILLILLQMLVKLFLAIE